MRDIIWTIIGIWVIYKLYEAFKHVSGKRTQTQSYQSHTHTNYEKQREGDVKVNYAQTKHKPHIKPEHGEYVDYEEVK